MKIISFSENSQLSWWYQKFIDVVRLKKGVRNSKKDFKKKIKTEFEIEV
jgi:hypothetical protein